MTDSAALRARLADVRDRIARAAGRAGRDPASIRLVAVSKTFSADHVRAAADAGQLDFGENKVQEALAEDASRPPICPLRWHLIGHLQSNKAGRPAALFDVIHSIDDAALLRKIDAAAAAAGTRHRAARPGRPGRASRPSTAPAAETCRPSSTPRAAAAPPG